MQLEEKGSCYTCGRGVLWLRRRERRDLSLVGIAWNFHPACCTSCIAVIRLGTEAWKCTFPFWGCYGPYWVCIFAGVAYTEPACNMNLSWFSSSCTPTCSSTEDPHAPDQQLPLTDQTQSQDQIQHASTLSTPNYEVVGTLDKKTIVPQSLIVLRVERSLVWVVFFIYLLFYLEFNYIVLCTCWHVQYYCFLQHPQAARSHSNLSDLEVMRGVPGTGEVSYDDPLRNNSTALMSGTCTQTPTFRGIWVGDGAIYTHWLQLSLIYNPNPHMYIPMAAHQ